MRVIIAVLLAFGITRCAVAQAQTAIDDYMAQFPAKREALAMASERLGQMCKDDPSDCRMRLMRLDMRSPGRWESRLLPPYRVILGVYEEELRIRTQVRLADEYVLGVSRVVGEHMDAGKMGEEAGRLIVDRAFAQSIEMIKKDMLVLRQSAQVGRQQDQAALETFASLVNLAASGLNMYVAALPAQVRVPSPPASLNPTRSYGSVRPPTSNVQCTNPLNAFAGMMLCVNSDGSVVAR